MTLSLLIGDCYGDCYGSCVYGFSSNAYVCFVSSPNNPKSKKRVKELEAALEKEKQEENTEN